MYDKNKINKVKTKDKQKSKEKKLTKYWFAIYTTEFIRSQHIYL